MLDAGAPCHVQNPYGTGGTTPEGPQETAGPHPRVLPRGTHSYSFGTSLGNSPLDMQCRKVPSHVDDVGSPTRSGGVPSSRRSRCGLPPCHGRGLSQHLVLLGHITVSDRQCCKRLESLAAAFPRLSSHLLCLVTR